MKIRQIPRSATVAWCPNDFYLASGTLVGTMSEAFDTAGTLEIFDVGMNSKNVDQPRVSVKTSDKLHKLVWSSHAALQSEQNPLGFIVGGSDSGVSIWNPKLLLEDPNDPNAQLAVPKGHTGAIKGLDFNPNQPSLLCAGGSGGEVLIWNLSTMVPYAPGPSKGPSGDSEITSVNWNRQVKHILATSAENGVVVVWDLKAKKPALSFKDPSSKSSRCSSVLWNPDSKINLITTIDDDSNPVIHLWDLQNYLAPSHTLVGHTKGVLSASFCPHDPNLLLTSGKDGKTLLWDLKRLKLISEIDSNSGWKFDVQWSPSLPFVTSTCSLEGQIELHSLCDFPRHPSTKGEPFVPPKWLQRPATVSFGFGGQLVSVHNQTEGKPGKVEIHKVNVNSDLLKKAEDLQAVIKEKAFLEFCEKKAESEPKEKPIWGFMKVLFDKTPRESLLSYLGFNPEAIPVEISNFIESVKKEAPVAVVEPVEVKEPEAPVPEPEVTTPQADDLFGDDGDNEFDISSVASARLPEGVQPTVVTPTVTEVPPAPLEPINFNSADPVEKLLTTCLLVGNWQSAVDCCFSVGRIADALVLASIGGPEMLARAQQRYLSGQKSSFMSLLAALTKKDFQSLVQRVEINHWRELLAILCAWTDSEFPQFCEQLGDRLLNETDDSYSALLAYMCAGSLEKATSVWLKEDVSSPDNLQEFIEKVVVFSQAIDQKTLPSEIANYFALYSDSLAQEGYLDVALAYLSNLKDVPGSPASLLYHRIKTALEQPTKPAPAPVSATKTASPLPKVADPRRPVTPSLPGFTERRDPPVPVGPVPVGPVPVGPVPVGPAPVGPVPVVGPASVGVVRPGVGVVRPVGPSLGPITPMTPSPPTQHRGVLPPPLGSPVTPVVTPITPVVPPVVRPTVRNLVTPPIISPPGPTPIISPPVPTGLAPPPASVLPLGPTPAIGGRAMVAPPRIAPGTYHPPVLEHTPAPAPIKKPKKEEPVAPPPMAGVAPRKIETQEHHVDVNEVIAEIDGVVQLLFNAGITVEEQRINDLRNKIGANEIPSAGLLVLKDFFSGLEQSDKAKIEAAFHKLNGDFYSKIGSTAMIGLKNLRQQFISR